jgi:hypothetical protein
MALLEGAIGMAVSTLPDTTPFTALVDTAKLRWRIERDFQDLNLKQEISLDHYEGRGWRGFHHHAALDRGLRIPHRREGSASPLGPHHPRARKTIPTESERLPSAWHRFGLSVTPRTPSRPSAA